MTETRALVLPSFGNWDIGTEVPYTTVFERVRAMKESNPANNNKLEGHHHINYSETSTPTKFRAQNRSGCLVAEEHHGRRFDRASDLYNRSESLSSRMSSIEQIADSIFTESQHAAGAESPVVSRQSLSSNTCWPSNNTSTKKESNEFYRRNGGHFYPINDTNSNELFARGDHDLLEINASHYHARLKENLGHNSHKEKILLSNIRSSQQAEQNKSTWRQEQQLNISGSKTVQTKALPKFGEWNTTACSSGVEYTMIFNKIRDDKKLTGVENSSLPAHCAASKAEEDLYKSDRSQKKPCVLWSFLCCKIS